MTVRRLERRSAPVAAATASAARPRPATRGSGAELRRLHASIGNRAVRALFGDADQARDERGRDDLGGQRVAPEMAAVLNRRRGAGTPLPPRVAGELGTGFGADLGALRVHTDPEAAGLAEALDSTAFAHGRDLYFSAGAYRPDSFDGRRLLAHEIAHTLLPGSAVDGPGTIGRAHAPAEHRADALADSALRGTAPAPVAAPAGTGGAIRRMVKSKTVGSTIEWYSTLDPATTFPSKAAAAAHDGSLKSGPPTRTQAGRGAKQPVNYAPMQKAPGYSTKRNPDWTYPDKPVSKAAQEVQDEYAARRKRPLMANSLTAEMVTNVKKRPKKYRTDEDKAMIATPGQSLLTAGISRNHKIADSSVTAICLQLVRRLGTSGAPTAGQQKAIKRFIAAFSSDPAVRGTVYAQLTAAGATMHGGGLALDDASVGPAAHAAAATLSLGDKNLRFGAAAPNEEISYAADYNRTSSGDETPQSEELHEAVLGLATAKLIPQSMAAAATTPAFETLTKALMSSSRSTG